MAHRWILALLVCAIPWAGNADPTLSASPDSVQVCAGGPQYVRVTDTPDASAAAPELGLDWRGPVNVVVSLEPLVKNDLHVAHSSQTWLLRVDAPNDTPVPGSVQVFLVDKSKRAAGQVIAGTSFKVQSAITGDAFPAKVEIDSAWQSLNEDERASVQVTITNQSSSALRVTKLRLDPGPFDVAPLGAKDTLSSSTAGGAKAVLFDVNEEVAPGSEFERTYALSIGKEVPAAGTYRVILSADLSGQINGCTRAVTLIAHKDMSFEVLGSSAILTAVGIPSFLLAPGFLMLMAAIILWKLGMRPKRVAADAAFPFPPKDTEFWVLAITLSLLVLLLPDAQQRFTNYRLTFVGFIWLASLLSAALVYLIIVMGINKYDAIKGAAALSETDDAEGALAKIAKLSKNTFIPLVQCDLTKAALGTGTSQRFMPMRMPSPAWTVPAIVFDWVAAVDANILREISAARGSRDLPHLASVLQRAKAASLITLEWDPDAPLLRPARIKEEAFIETGTAELVREKT